MADPSDGAGGGDSTTSSQPALRAVYPVLQSGFEKLLKVVEERDRLNSAPDVEFCPLRFLAEHLMRNNPAHR